MKRMRLIFLLVAIVVVAAWYLTTEPAGPEAPRQTAAKTDLPCHEYTEHRKNVDVEIAIPTLKDKKATAYKVLEVIDGDTISVAKNGKTTVRLIGIDTPEKSTTRTGSVEYFGEEAYRHAKTLIEQSGNEVRLTYDQSKQDKYGRDLAYVWLKDGRMLNALLVADGFAYSYTASPKPEYVDLFLALMRQARSQNKGLWGVCQ